MQNTGVLILGAGGRLGGLLRRIWADRPAAKFDLHFQSRTPLPGGNTWQWTPGQSPDHLPACQTVIALWGRTAGDPEALAMNAALADESRAVALACGASRLLHLSSAAVYGPTENACEATPAAPITPYGQSKLAMEGRVGSFNDPQLHHVCLRLANVLGADSLAPALTGNAPVILDRFADGAGPLRSYIGAEDLADLLLALAHLPPVDLPAILNVAAHTPLTMQDLAEAAGKDITWRDASPQAIQRVTMDTSCLADLVPALHPVTDARELIRRWQRHGAQR